MSTIENFAALPIKDQREFASALIDTLNSENIFTSETDFVVTHVEADDYSGGLVVEVRTTEPIKVSRKATWQCSEMPEVENDPGYSADYKNPISEDLKQGFKIFSTEINDYLVTLEITDGIEAETVEVTAENTRHEDSGVGHNEFWGSTEFDSHPYVEVDGIIVQECNCTFIIFVDAKEI